MECKAQITTKVGKAYKTIANQKVTEYFIDSAMDTDSDTWSITMGDPRIDDKKKSWNSLKASLRRDAEVRAEIVIFEKGKAHPLHKGFADSVALTQDGLLVIDGRDITSVAVDSTAMPKMHKHVRPHKLVAKEARELQIADKLNLGKAHTNFKKFFTDGSESYWEKWYRMYRKSSMWMWAEPDGTLVAGDLNYDQKPTYNFGSPVGIAGPNQGWIPVERLEWRNTKNSRLWEVYVVGQKANVSIPVRVRDPALKSWIRKPRRIIESADANSEKEARREGYEELFEGKVGSTEIRLTVGNPGHMIRQNRMARVNLPTVGLKGIFFIVGVRIVGGSDGMYMEVRLREKGYAISRRVPDDPRLRTPDKDTSDSLMGGGLTGVRWGDCFVAAAKEFHNQFGYQLFLATLLAIADQESGFRNIRHMSPSGGPDGTTEWYRPPSIVIKGASAKIRKHRNLFANEKKFGYVADDRAVGPMGLYSVGYKHWADDYGRPHGFARGHDEVLGGRWHPCSNIRAGARALIEKARGSAGSKADLAAALAWYFGGGPNSVGGRSYANSIMKKVDEDYLPIVKDASEQAANSRNNTGGVPGGKKGVQIPKGAAYFQRNQTHKTLGLGWPAIDLGFARQGYGAGSRVLAPENGRMGRFTGKSPSLGGASGGAMGYSCYYFGQDTSSTYMLTHLSAIAPHGQYKRGDVIAVIADGPSSWSDDHVHACAIAGKHSYFSGSDESHPPLPKEYRRN